MTEKFIVLIPCAGIGARFGSEMPKQYRKISGQTILAHTLKPFLSNTLIEQVLLVANPHDRYIDEYTKLSEKIIVRKVGGSSRAISVLNGLGELSCCDEGWVLVHDAVRCCLTPTLLNKLLNQIKNSQVGGILAVAASDTIKEIAVNAEQVKIVRKTLVREQIYLAQTPQMFRYGILKKALMNVDLADITDEASAIEKLGLNVEIVESNKSNIKITYPEDIYLAEFLLKARLMF